MTNPPLAMPAGAPARRQAVALWLLACCTLVLSITVVGGITRLTRSGLSIVEWRPIAGTLPPLSDADWLDTFTQYRQTPEYRLVNQGMSLGEFKVIFWWEYVHRLLGRLIGLAFVAPLAWFTLRGDLEPRLARRLLGIFLLGGAQGVVGWWMVRSGLVDEPHVSHLRLAAHLAIAFLVFAGILWTALSLLARSVAPGSDGPRTRRACRRAYRLAWVVSGVLAYMVVTGGLVAGTHAGKAYNTFPLMSGHLVPPGVLALEPWWRNVVDNPATVQLEHRAGAWLVALLVPWLWLAVRRVASRRVRIAGHVLLAMLAVQVGLGISTLLLAVPVALGAAHQAGALLLAASALALQHALHDVRVGSPGP